MLTCAGTDLSSIQCKAGAGCREIQAKGIFSPFPVSTPSHSYGVTEIQDHDFTCFGQREPTRNGYGFDFYRSAWDSALT